VPKYEASEYILYTEAFLFNLFIITATIHPMSLSIGIVGLPNVGKSTLFNALLKKQTALAANYPFATIEPNIGIVEVPDTRLDVLAQVVRNDYGVKIGDRELPEKIIHSLVKFYDIAGLVKGASQGEGLGNAFLSHIKEVDALIHLVRDFEDDNIIRAGSVDPENDIYIINTELVLADYQFAEKKLDQLVKGNKGLKSKGVEQKIEVLQKVTSSLSSGVSGRELNLSSEEIESISEFNLLTMKPVFYVYNVAEATYKVKSKLNSQNRDKIYICAKLESDLAGFDEDEKKEFMKELGIEEMGLDRVIRTGYELLGLQDFLTAGPKEVRAWTIRKGTTAQKAAGKIHSDFEKAFIAADIIAFEALKGIESIKRAREKGLLRLEGKEYVMQDGDVVEFRVNA
jgi:GTP-binding protein YchF